jgi:hypothetical protein
MNEEYLWDKSGEPDPKIQRLEEILGTLRYQEKPLELPEQIIRPRSHNRVFMMAIAATVLLGLLAAGLWLKARDAQLPKKEIAVTPARTIAPSPQQSPVQDYSTKSAVPKDTVATDKGPKRKPQLAKARVPVQPVLSGKEREEALAAKQQVLLALRLTTEKLSEVQRRTIGPTPQIKNQHKAG